MSRFRLHRPKFEKTDFIGGEVSEACLRGAVRISIVFVESRIVNFMKGRIASVILAGAGMFFANGAQGSVIISEIMHHPQSDRNAEQWFELYNTEDSPVDLSGWVVSEGCHFVFPAGTAIGARDYLVVAANSEIFSSLYPEVKSVVGNWAGSIGSHIRLADALGRTVDDVNFATDGDWAQRRLGEIDNGHRGWEWYCEHDGTGKSLELVNRALSNEYALNWSSSATDGGTPGAVNSRDTDDAAPIIIEVAHRPIIPGPNDPVTITAAVLDEDLSGVRTTLFWRVDGQSEFQSLPMNDDGLHGDGLANDGVYAATLAPLAQGTIVEFRVQAVDGRENERVYPNVILPTDSGRTANLLYQVDGNPYEGPIPRYYIIMREIERAELHQLSSKSPDAMSNAKMNATWISRDGIEKNGKIQYRYNAGIRNRGNGTRVDNPHNYHVAIPSDRRWKEMEGINLNARYSYSQVLGSAIFQKAGVLCANSKFAELRVNSRNLMGPGVGISYGLYAANEQYNNRLVKRHWPDDPEGNLYRGYGYKADFSWHGDDFLSTNSYTNYYFKENHAREKDYSDLISLCGVLSVIPEYSTDETYVSRVREVLDVEEWMRYMAANTLLRNDETCLANGSGDDYGLYRGVNDPRFRVIAYDSDSLMGWGRYESLPEKGIWSMTNLVSLNRFMKHPEFTPIYLNYLKTFSETLFSPGQMDPFLDQILGGKIPQDTITKMKRFNSNQVHYVLGQFSQKLTLESSFATNKGFLYTTNSSISLSGKGDGTRTRNVYVNEVQSLWTPWKCEWGLENIDLNPGMNKFIVRAVGLDNREIERMTVDIWYDTSAVREQGGVLAADTVWTAAEGPYRVTSSLTVPAGVTLRIEAGTTVYMNPDLNLIVEDGGILLVEGEKGKMVSFLSEPGGTTRWGGVKIYGSIGSPETVISYACFQDNASTCIVVDGGTLRLENTIFANNKRPYLSVENASFLVDGCFFPNVDTGSVFEPVHGDRGIKKGGRGIFRNCFFGKPFGYNDTVDYTGGDRGASEPLVQFINNVFIGSEDDILDLDGADAWIEGNIFLHAHRGPSTGNSSSAVSGGVRGNYGTSEITIIGNIFYDCDSAITAKIGNYYTAIGNTIVRSTRQGGSDSASGVVNLADPGAQYGKGCYLEGNIIVDIEQLVRNYNPAASLVTFTNNILSMDWTGPGGNNRLVDPVFKHVPVLEETFFENFEQAQVMWDWLSLSPASPAIKAGIYGADMGAAVERGIYLSPAPNKITNERSATFHVGPLITIDESLNIPDFPIGSGFTHYRWRLDGGEWSQEYSSHTPIELNDLEDGPHYVEVIGKSDVGFYQNDPELWGPLCITRSATWTVDSRFDPQSEVSIRINEISPDAGSIDAAGRKVRSKVELCNFGTAPADISGMGLTTSLDIPHWYTFPESTVLGAGEFIVLEDGFSDDGDYASLGFELKKHGGNLYLQGRADHGGKLLDSVSYGIQAADYSLGRINESAWNLCVPSFGAANEPVTLNSIDGLCINEWMSDGNFITPRSFIELYNKTSRPINFGGCYLSNSTGSPMHHRVPELSFIAAGDRILFYADEKTQLGVDHLPFKLNTEMGIILLSDSDLNIIDQVQYGSQFTDISMGRTPDGGDKIVSFSQPTPGYPNMESADRESSIVVSNTFPLLALGSHWRYYQDGSLDGTAWMSPQYDDSGWMSGPGLLGAETSALPSPGLQTPMTVGKMTYYFRTSVTMEKNLADPILEITTVLDDGALIYLNGAPIFTNGMPPGAILYNSPAYPGVGNAVEEHFTLRGFPLNEGENVIAAEVHQITIDSTDFVWGMSLTALELSTNIVDSGASAARLNEVMSLGGPEDYVEFYNPSDYPIDLSNVGFTDDPSLPHKWMFPTNTFLNSKSFLKLPCGGVPSPAELSATIPLSAEGKGLYLFNTEESGGGLIDAVQYGLQAAGYSIGRTPDGLGQWALNIPSPGESNHETALGDPSLLRINEWMASPSSGSDWLEIYNPGSYPVALAGLYLSDDLINPFKSPIAPLSFIGTGESAFALFYATGDITAGKNHAGFALKKSGESVGLFSPIGLLIDGIVFGQQLQGVSEGRFPDGEEQIIAFRTTASPNSSNYLPPADVVTITGCEMRTDAFVIQLDDIADAYKVQVTTSLAAPIIWEEVEAQKVGNQLIIMHADYPQFLEPQESLFFRIYR